MSETEILEQLRDLRFLQDIDDEYLRQIAAVANSVTFPANKVIFHEGGPLSQVSFIVRGSVALELCASGIGCRRLLTLADGDLLGLSPLVGEPRSAATARTLAASELIQLDARQILTLCEHNPAFGYEFMRRAAEALSHRLNATRLQLLDVYGSQATAAPRQGDK